MQLHTDLTQRAAVHAAQTPWRDSPIAGVQRRPLHRLGEEVAQATTIVRYAPGSQFRAHQHTGGEEFLVLEGVFQDEHGSYPKGSYLRNPPGTSHTPGSVSGTTIFVKLWQFDPQDRTPVRVLGEPLDRIPDTTRTGVHVSPLFKNAHEDVRLEYWAPNTPIELSLPQGGEFLILDGSFEENGETFAPQSWLRLHCGATLHANTGPQGAQVWAKLGHLRHQAQLPLPPQG